MLLCLEKIITWKTGYAGVRVGEASNPGPSEILRVAFGNVSSYILHQNYINTVPCDIFGMCETRLNDAGFRLVRESLEDMNWSFIPGEPQLQRRAGAAGRILDAMPGGVAFLAKSHIPFVRTPFLLDYTAEEKRRVMSITILPNSGQEPLRLYQVYGFARARDDPERMNLNEALLNKVLREANAAGNIPTVIMGDFNIEPDFSAELSAAIFEGYWTDAGTIKSKIDGSLPLPTFSQKGVNSRVDICLLNNCAMNLFWDFIQWDHEDCTIPNHKMQCLSLRIGGRKQTARKPFKPHTLPDFRCLPETDSAYLTHWVIDKFIDELSANFEEDNVDGFWGIWCQMAEQWIIQHCAISNADDTFVDNPKYLGRGQFRSTEEVVNLKRRDIDDGGNVVDPRLSSALKIRRILDEIISKKVRQPNLENVAEIENLWAKAARIASSDCKVSQTVRLRVYKNVPSREIVASIRDEMQKFVNNRGEQLRKLRLKRYDEEKQRRLISNPSEAFHYLKPEVDPPLTVLQREDGSITGNVVEMDGILRKKWGTIFCKHSGDRPAPKVSPFMKKYKQFIQNFPMKVNSITVEEIRGKLRKCKDSGATGLDAWSPKDFKKLPDAILSYLCVFYDMVERLGKWPFDLTHAAVTLIPKNEGFDPLNLRPISVLPIAYRVWAAVRCSHCTSWQEKWITSGQHGCRQGHSTSDALLRLAAELENASLTGDPIFGAALDFAKAFDNVPVDIALNVLEQLGINERILKPLTFMYQKLQRYFKIRGFLGEAFHATNGIMQGCPLSCLLLNALVSILSKSILAHVPVNLQSYVDDITILTKDQDTLRTAFRVLEPYLFLTDQNLNVSKTYVFAINHQEELNITFNGQTLPISNKVKILGVKFYFSLNSVSFHYVPDDLNFVEAALARIENSHLPFWARSLVIAGSIVSKLTHGCEIRQLDDSQERRLKNSITPTLWGSRSTKRTPGVLYTILTKGHTVDIVQAILTSRWLKYCRALRNDASLGDLVLRNFKLCVHRKFQKVGPGEALLHSTRRLRFLYETSSSIRLGDMVFDLLTCNLPKLGHCLRDLGRKMVWRQVRTDALRSKRALGDALPHLHDIGGGEGVDRIETMKSYQKSSDNGHKGVLRTILCNGVWTNSARAKLPENLGLSPICPHCNSGKVETIIHLWWECPAWVKIRRNIFHTDYPYVELQIDKLPSCTRTCGIINKGCTITEGFVESIQTMMAEIFKERVRVRRA